MKTYPLHIEEFDFDEPILVQYYVVPGLAPSPRTMSNPMGTDDGCPPEVCIMSARDFNGQPYDLSKHEQDYVVEKLLEIYGEI